MGLLSDQDAYLFEEGTICGSAIRWARTWWRAEQISPCGRRMLAMFRCLANSMPGTNALRRSHRADRPGSGRRLLRAWSKARATSTTLNPTTAGTK